MIGGKYDPRLQNCCQAEMECTCRASNPRKQCWYFLSYLSPSFVDRNNVAAGAYVVATFSRLRRCGMVCNTANSIRYLVTFLTAAKVRRCMRRREYRLRLQEEASPSQAKFGSPNPPAVKTRAVQGGAREPRSTVLVPTRATFYPSFLSYVTRLAHSMLK